MLRQPARIETVLELMQTKHRRIEGQLAGALTPGVRSRVVFNALSLNVCGSFVAEHLGAINSHQQRRASEAEARSQRVTEAAALLRSAESEPNGAPPLVAMNAQFVARATEIEEQRARLFDAYLQPLVDGHYELLLKSFQVDRADLLANLLAELRDAAGSHVVGFVAAAAAGAVRGPQVALAAAFAAATTVELTQFVTGVRRAMNPPDVVDDAMRASDFEKGLEQFDVVAFNWCIVTHGLIQAIHPPASSAGPDEPSTGDALQLARDEVARRYAAARAH